MLLFRFTDKPLIQEKKKKGKKYNRESNIKQPNLSDGMYEQIKAKLVRKKGPVMQRLPRATS